MRLVVTIQEILVTVSEKKKNLIIQVMLSELVIQGTKKNMLYSCVDLYPVGLNELIENTGLSSQEISNALVELELEGKIEEVADNCYVRIYV